MANSIAAARTKTEAPNNIQTVLLSSFHAANLGSAACAVSETDSPSEGKPLVHSPLPPGRSWRVSSLRSSIVPEGKPDPMPERSGRSKPLLPFCCGGLPVSPSGGAGRSVSDSPLGRGNIPFCLPAMLPGCIPLRFPEFPAAAAVDSNTSSSRVSPQTTVYASPTVRSGELKATEE